MSIAVLGMLVFSKYIYLASLTSYFTFYLIQTFGVSVQHAQLHLFIFLGAVAAGTFARRPDRRPLRPEIRDLGVDPGRAALHAGHALCRIWTGTVMLSHHHRPDPGLGLLRHRRLCAGAGARPQPGMIAGLFFGFAFGMGGIGAAVLGEVADRPASASSTRSAHSCR